MLYNIVFLVGQGKRQKQPYAQGVNEGIITKVNTMDSGSLEVVCAHVPIIMLCDLNVCANISPGA